MSVALMASTALASAGAGAGAAAGAHALPTLAARVARAARRSWSSLSAAAGRRRAAVSAGSAVRMGLSRGFASTASGAPGLADAARAVALRTGAAGGAAKTGTALGARSAVRRAGAGTAMAAAGFSSTTYGSGRGGARFSEREHAHTPATRPVVDIYAYPPKGHNTCVNTCPQGAAMIIERFGKYLRTEKPGLFFAIPVIDHIRFVHDLREIPIAVAPQEAISRDNVTVRLDGTVYAQVVDPYIASYNVNKPLYAVVQHAQSAMRAAVGRMDLDDLYHARAQLNAQVAAAIEDASKAWGVKVLRFEISGITPDDKVRKAMDLQAVAERERREEVLRSEASKRAMELRSEGKRLQDVNESEGVKQRMINEGEGQKQRIIKAAEAEAAAIKARADATADALNAVSAALCAPNGAQALAAHLAREYFGAFSALAKGSTTIVIPQNIADVSGMVAGAMAVVDKVSRATAVATAPATGSSAPSNTAVGTGAVDDTDVVPPFGSGSSDSTSGTSAQRGGVP